jgi:hypothetical protein
MDLLASLNMDDLPEQQTRTMHLIREHPDFQLHLGFDACCTCGKAFSSAAFAMTCPGCHRVKYCSESCRQKDSEAISLTNLADVGQEEEMDSAMGHSSVMCALLRCCQDDEVVKDNESPTDMDRKRVQAARDRIQSELESYPATLANVISEGPCYQSVLRLKASTTKTLIVHVVGASDDAELWDLSKDGGSDNVFVAYTEALSDLATSRGLDVIKLVFVGPDCPDTNVDVRKSFQSFENPKAIFGELQIQTLKGLYNEDRLDQHGLQKPDIVIFFNPGFTVPEYSWNEALASIEKGTPFLSTTNTELEGVADCQYLMEQDKIETIPPGLAHIFDLCSEGNEETDDEGSPGTGTAFFSVNPFSGSRIRQSGTLANDIFVKNRWILGGILNSFDLSKANSDTSSKRRRAASDSKFNNPALI